MKKRNTPNTPFSFFIFLFSFFILLFSCQKSTNPVQTGSLNLELLDVTCTEAFLGLKFDPGYLNKTLSLYRGDSLIASRPLSAADTILLAENLWPNTSYEFKAVLTEGEKRLASSPALRITTMDTTSHNFTWQTWEFGGQGGSSAFYDVAIIDENDVWAVGEIYTEDDKYNAAHWDGEKWELKKLDWDGIVSRLTCVFAFSSDDVWFGVTNLIHWNGFTFEKNWNPVLDEFYDKTINKIWGTSSEDMYVVGNKGLIAHYDGREWRQIESGTDLNINDIWGSKDKSGKGYEIICVASNHLSDPAYSRKILQIQNGQTIEKSTYPIKWTLYSTWFIHHTKYFVSGGGIYEKYFLENKKWVNNNFDITPYYIYNIRGSQTNNIIAVGGFGEVVHFNGLSWKSFYDETKISGNYYSVAINNNKFVITGYSGRTAIIKIGTNY